MNDLKLGFIGGGNMGFSLLKGFKQKNLFSKYFIFDTDKKVLAKAENLGVSVCENNEKLIKNSNIIFLCVKPQTFFNESFLNSLKNEDKSKLFVSIMTGVKLKTLRNKLKSEKIIRVMPNILCVINEMSSGFCKTKEVNEKEVAFIKQALDSVGESFFFENEKMLNIVTGISGSGPAFVTKMIKAMIKAGIEEGLNEEIAKKWFYKHFLELQ